MTAPCWSKADVGRIKQGFELSQLSAQPPSATSESDYWLATTYSSFQPTPLVDRAWVGDQYKLAHKIWGTRIFRSTANNTGSVGGWMNSRFSGYLETRVPVDRNGDVREARVNFDTFARANACMVIQTMWSLGYTLAEILDHAWVDGVFTAADMVPWATFLASPETYCTVSSGSDANPTEFWAAQNVVFIPSRRIVDSAASKRAIKIDWEMQDGRSEADALALATLMADLCHDKGVEFHIWSNTLNNTGALYSGLTQNNLWDIHNVVDDITLMLFNDSDSTDETRVMQAQRSLDLIGHQGVIDPHKVSVTFALGNPAARDTTVQEAKDIRRWMERNGLHKVQLWRNGASQAGDCYTEVNQKIAAIGLRQNVPNPSISNFIV